MPKNNKLGCSYATQQKLAKSLKELMENESFEKLSVSDITSNCNLHRQTFYYHFEDKYELLDWIVYEELILPIITEFKIDNIYEKFYNIFETMSRERKFYQNSLKINTEELSRYISKIAHEYVRPLVKSVKAENLIKFSDENNDSIFSEFLCYGISGVIISWVQRGMKESPQEMTMCIKSVISGVKILITQRKSFEDRI